ncbi:tetraacyldisaccharide 4'-kinase [Salinicola peritrichatus]|uniref:tetraacyldisaccharide 4'-kinase n=1 Tax=Salinicola peritrichatus TaxID=1267424 RepID=UPI000DA12CCC|nr:tetraacyldisaccharide 4'-kinase [Salinicola peritrichatus]
MTPIERAWYRNAPWLALLAPLEALYRAGVQRRRRAFEDGRREIWKAPVPVVVVGNLSVGGTGKSPLVAWLARWLKAQGWRPGIVSRGYGGKAPTYPLLVDDRTPVEHCGDEPLMLALQSGVAVAVDPDRPRAARALIDTRGCDVLLADDGLQHYALGRTLELVVIDGQRGLGNRRCLPRGPLREPVERLREADALVGNGGFAGLQPEDGAGVARFTMRIAPRVWRHLASGATYPVETPPFSTGVPVVALAGIGHPQRFFDTLDALGVAHRPRAFGDHHRFVATDLPPAPATVVMTAKDGVKCRAFADDRCWVLDIEALPEPAFEHWWAGCVAQWDAATGVEAAKARS